MIDPQEWSPAGTRPFMSHFDKFAPVARFGRHDHNAFTARLIREVNLS